MNDKHIIISDELLSAFLDGNTSAEDTIRVLKAAEQDKDLQEIIRIASEVDEDMASLKPGAPDKPCGVGRADANPKLLLNDT